MNTHVLKCNSSLSKEASKGVFISSDPAALFMLWLRAILCVCALK